MFTNRNRLSALALGTLLSISALQPALAADGTERADINASKWLEQQLQSTDGSPTPAFQDRLTSVYQGASMTVPQRADTNANTWLDRQLRASDGNPDGQ
jgi:hypothetical protein